MFKNGWRGYVKVRPRRHQLVFSGVAIPPVMKGMNDAFDIFAGKCIQNNHSETTNNTLRSVVNLGGQRSVDHLAGRIRSVMRLRNDPALKPRLNARHRYRGNIYLKRMAGADFKPDYSNYSIEMQT